jgi:transcriptional regulator with XRE-family HTH domain
VDYESLINRLIQAREQRSVDRAEFARRWGVSKQKLGHWENMRNRVTLEDLEAWAQQLGLHLVVEVTADEGLQRAAEFALLRDQLSDERTLVLDELLSILPHLGNKEFRLLRGMIHQLAEEVDHTRSQSAGQGKVGTLKPA